MTESTEPEKKAKKQRRAPEEVAAEYERRAARIKHAGKREALGMLRNTYGWLGDAQTAAGNPPEVRGSVETALQAISEAIEKLEALIPEEAR